MNGVIVAENDPSPLFKCVDVIVAEDNFAGGDEGFTRLHSFYLDLLKRLNDSSDEIRLVEDGE